MIGLRWRFGVWPKLDLHVLMNDSIDPDEAAETVSDQAP